MTIQLGPARALDAETFGRPGERTFRLRILAANAQSASIWMEKEQFQALSMALAQVLSQMSYEGPSAESSVDEFPEVADHDLRAGRMAISLDPQAGAVSLYAYDILAEEESDPTLRVDLNAGQCQALRGQVDAIIAAGRPICPLCHVSVDPAGHACIRSNGHSTQPLPDQDAGSGEEQQ